MTASRESKVLAKIQGNFLPETRQPLPDIAQRFYKPYQTLQDFHQPLPGLIRRLKEFVQALKRTAPMPAAGQSAFWKYNAVYLAI